MENINLRPSVINSLYDVEKQLKSVGLDEDDILVLLQKRIKGRPAKKQIKAILDGLKKLESDLIHIQEKNLP